jgi:hypothetical protein
VCRPRREKPGRSPEKQKEKKMKMKMKRNGMMTAMALLLSTTGFADILVGLNVNGELWRGDTSDIAGTKTLLATLTGTGYIDSAFDGQYLYGLRNDGTVYRSDLSGNVSAVALTGWDSSVHSINADSGTLYGMGTTGANRTVKTADGTTVVSLATTTQIYSDFTVTDDGLIWCLLTTGGDKAYAYGYTNGYSGAISGQTKFANMSNSKGGLALVSDGTELYCAASNGAVNTPVRYTTGGTVTAVDNAVAFLPGFAALDKGSALFGVLTDGSVESLVLGGSSRVLLGTLSDADTVGLEVIPEPATLGLFMVSAAGILGVRRLLSM